MENLPYELKLELLLDVGYPDFLELCQTDTSFNRICQDDTFWRRLFERDYYKEEQRSDLSWRQAYINRRNTVKNFANMIVREYLLADPKYVRQDVMIQDLVKLLNDFLKEHRDSKIYKTTDLDDLAVNALAITSGLRRFYVGSSDKEFNVFKLLPELNIRIDLYEFLKSIGFLMDLKEARERGYEEESDEDEE